MAGLTASQTLAKRTLDVAVSVTVLLVLGWLILACAAVSALVHGGSGFFLQERIGKGGRPFVLAKLTTMRRVEGIDTTVTTANDPRVTGFGRFLRRTRLDELPQFVNVLLGDMSLVGPRPDVPGFADRLSHEDRVVLSVLPGITGPATLAYRNEAELLAQQSDPERFNREVIYPDKVRLNRQYVEEYSVWRDLVYLWRTAFGP